jgi:hypothetical protein
MLPPLPRCSGWAYSSLFLPSRVSLPRKGRRVGLHIVLFEACSAFTRVAACTLARPPIRDPLYRRLQPFRRFHDCSGCFRLERLPGGTFIHWKAPPFHGAHPLRTFKVVHPDALPTQGYRGPSGRKERYTPQKTPPLHHAVPVKNPDTRQRKRRRPCGTADLSPYQRYWNRDVRHRPLPPL